MTASTPTALALACQLVAELSRNPTPEPEPTEIGIRIQDADHLDSLIAQVVNDLGLPTVRDRDGDLPLPAPTAGSLAFVRRTGTDPFCVRLLGLLEVDGEEARSDAMLRKVNALNRGLQLARAVLNDDHVALHVEYRSERFSAETLRASVGGLVRLLEEVAEQLGTPAERIAPAFGAPARQPSSVPTPDAPDEAPQCHRLVSTGMYL